MENLQDILKKSAILKVFEQDLLERNHLSAYSTVQMGKLKVFLIAIVVLTQLVDVSSTSVSDYVNQVIYVESYRYRGRWLDAFYDPSSLFRYAFPNIRFARFTDSPESSVVYKTWSKWIVRQGPGNTLALESVRFPNHFLDAHDSGYCRVTYSSYPYNKVWALWYLEYSSGKYAFRSKRFSGSRLDAHDSGSARVTAGSGKWSQMRIYQPKIAEIKTLIFTYNNTKGSTPIKVSFTEKIGISRTDTQSSSYTISAEMGLEIKSIFSAKTSFSATWARSTSTTWTKETSRTVEVTVKLGTVKKIYQLQGTYGPFKVSSNHLFFEG